MVSHGWITKVLNRLVPGADNMGRKDNAHGTKFDPLTADQIARFIAAAQQPGDDLTTITALTLPSTGLRSSELCHVRRAWLQGEAQDSAEKESVVEWNEGDDCTSDEDQQNSGGDDGC